MRGWRAWLIGAITLSCSHVWGETQNRDAVLIHAQDEMVMDQKASLGWALGYPKAWYQDKFLKADRFKVIFHPETRKISQIKAQGGMLLTTPTQSLQGAEGLYEVTPSYAWCRGEPAVLFDPHYTLTTYGILQVWTQEGYGLASGRSRLDHTPHHLWGDMMTLQQTKPSPHEPAVLDQAHVWGDVLLVSQKQESEATTPSSPDSLVQGQKAVYLEATQEVIMSGNILCQKQEHYLQGAWAKVDLDHHTTTILARDPHTPPQEGAPLCGALLYPDHFPSNHP